MPLPGLLRHKVRDSIIRQLNNRNYLTSYLALSSWDVVSWEDDFLGDQFRYDATAPGAYQTATSGAASEGFTMVAPTAASRSGAATLKSGTDNNGYAGASLGLNWYGENNALMLAIIKSSAITTFKVECGFTDVTAGTDAGAVNVLGTASTTTWNATDAALWIIDTNLTGSWRHVGVVNNTTTALGVPGAGGLPAFANYNGDVAPVADTYELLGVALNGGSARFFRGHMVSTSAGTDLAGRLTLTYDSDWIASYLTSTIALTPWLFVQSRAGAASRTLTVDFLGVYQYRYNAD